ncbi:hypothetical protein E1301_Tti019995 [Triplophysa tibetana]|uniref:Uncharacterized protein n=1 Tax=Triplophysa tibetana TaxID=1572043 RepID=A0A5A9NVH2_9TELE|nr:hypothetical protein E1301_Tti019995 [Triplophysa tibetana]
MNGPKRTWQQVKIKYKNILHNAVKKNTHRQGTGGGSPKADLTPEEDMALELNKGRLPGGKETSIGSSQDATRFIQVSGSTVFLLEPPAQAPDDADPGESPSAAATAHDGDDDEEETISLDSRRHESSQAIRKLYGNHLRRQIELADIDIQYKKKQMENLALESEIKKRTIRKLDLEIKKLERELTLDRHQRNAPQHPCDLSRPHCSPEQDSTGTSESAEILKILRELVQKWPNKRINKDKPDSMLLQVAGINNPSECPPPKDNSQISANTPTNSDNLPDNKRFGSQNNTPTDG